jgi:hypothetical protein
MPRPPFTARRSLFCGHCSPRHHRAPAGCSPARCGTCPGHHRAQRARPSGRADPRGPSAACRHEAPGRATGAYARGALTDRYRSSRSCESVPAIGRRRRLAQRGPGRRRRQTSSHCATPTPGALRAVERRNVPPVRTVVTRFRPRRAQPPTPALLLWPAKAVVSCCRGRRSVIVQGASDYDGGGYLCVCPPASVGIAVTHCENGAQRCPSTCCFRAGAPPARTPARCSRWPPPPAS